MTVQNIVQKKIDLHNETDFLTNFSNSNKRLKITPPLTGTKMSQNEDTNVMLILALY